MTRVGGVSYVRGRDVKLEAKTSNQFVVFCKHLGRAHEKKNIPIFAPSKCLMYVAGGRGESPPNIAW